MSIKQIMEQLEEAGLKEYSSAIVNWIFPTAELILNPVPDITIPIGASKVGGNPDLPNNMQWPKWKDYEMTFIAQINLAECPVSIPLPKSGLLSFFYAVEPMYEDDEFYDNPNTCKVFYFDAELSKQTIRSDIPNNISDSAKMKPNKIMYKPGLSVPTAESSYLESLGLGWNGNRDHFDKYWKYFMPKWQKEGYINRLMGHPDQVQGDMQVSCELAVGSYSWHDLNDSVIKEKIVQSALKWRLLLQIDSEEDKTGIMWGDVGRIYFWIHEDDLASLCFERVVCEMQCG